MFHLLMDKQCEELPHKWRSGANTQGCCTCDVIRFNLDETNCFGDITQYMHAPTRRCGNESMTSNNEHTSAQDRSRRHIITCSTSSSTVDLRPEAYAYERRKPTVVRVPAIRGEDVTVKRVWERDILGERAEGRQSVRLVDGTTSPIRKPVR